MILAVLFCALAAAGLTLQWRVMRHHTLPVRLLHISVAAALWAGMLPALLNLEKTSEDLRGDEDEKGMVLLDVSASMLENGELPRRLRDFRTRLEKEGGAELQWVEFSEGCLPPYGKSGRARGTDLALALRELDGLIRKEGPDWLWVISDGGFSPPAALPDGLRTVAKYVTALPGTVVAGGDYGVSGIESDPVWYTRTSCPVRARFFRSGKSGREEVDVLCLVDGALSGAAKAVFGEDSQSAEVEFQAMSPHLGTARLEIAIAEGQGGAIPDNDRMVRHCQVVRDKIRILRVVGRPTWSSKFLRDMLVRREDVDLVDFHILRSMTDNPHADSNDLALIPFPVEELFSENIESFDLIIWQDFNSNSYPFFLPIYLQNVCRFVEQGGGILFVAGHLPWNFQKGEFSDLVAQRMAGSVFARAEEGLRIAEPGHSLFTERLKKRMVEIKPIAMDFFPGPLNPGAQVLLRAGEYPVLCIRAVGAGRVASLATDGLWRFEFNDGKGGEGLYEELMGRVLLWLQKHPDLVDPGFSLPQSVPAGGEAEISLSPSSRGAVLSWKRTGEQQVLEERMGADAEKARVKAPAKPGVYEVRIKDGRDPVLVTVRSLEDEYLPESARKAGVASLLAAGFSGIPLQDRSPWAAEGKARGAKRSGGVPWHRSWAYLGVMVCLLFIHWLMVSSAPAPIARKA